MYACMYVVVFKCMYMHMSAHSCIHVYIYTHTDACPCICICVSRRAAEHTVSMRACMCMYIGP